jgi:hypothetical protein
LYEEEEHGFHRQKEMECESEQEATIPSQQHSILNELNRYPALILNADYQVRQQFVNSVYFLAFEIEIIEFLICITLVVVVVVVPK